MTRTLPKYVHFKNGAYYHVKNNIWTRLGTELADVPERVEELTPKLPWDLSRKEMMKMIPRMKIKACNNAKTRQIEFALSYRDIYELFEAAKWKCAVTGTKFSTETVNGKRPYLPSIDRIDSLQGYVAGNCRIVCVATNYAMNVWGDAVLLELVANTKQRLRKDADLSKSVDKTGI